MANPARELHTLFSGWRAAHEADGGGAFANALHIQEASGAAEMRQAYALLTSIELLLRRMQAKGSEVGVFIRQLDGWSRVPLLIDAGWKSNAHADHLINETRLDQIETLALYLDGKVHSFDDADRSSLSEIVIQAHEALIADESLSPQLREYLHHLLAEIRTALDDERVGRAFDFAEACRRLWVAIRAASAESDDEDKRNRWKKIGDAILIGTASSAVVEAASAAVRFAIGS